MVGLRAATVRRPAENGLPAVTAKTPAVLGATVTVRSVVTAIAPSAGMATAARLFITIGLFLVLHELATNAAKYGALSVEAGEILIAWSLPDDGRRLDLTWTERGGPPVTPPASRGFGSKLIERIVTRSLGGSMTIDYPASGLEARLMLPLRGRRAPA